jgi:hypothetical protein
MLLICTLLQSARKIWSTWLIEAYWCENPHWAFFDIQPKGHKTILNTWQHAKSCSLDVLSTDDRKVTKQCHTCSNNPRANQHSKAHCCYPAAKINIYLKALHLENTLTIRLYITFRWRDFPDNSYLARTTHSLQRLQRRILLINN